MNQPTVPENFKPGLNIMLNGVPGSGKTHAIRTFLDAGITPFVIFTEPGNVLWDVKDKVHWRNFMPKSLSAAKMKSIFELMNTSTPEALQAMKHLDKNQHKELIEFTAQLNNFYDEVTGEHFGNVSEWGTDRALIIDGLSGLTAMARAMYVGDKPTLALADYTPIQFAVEQAVNWCTLGTWCHFVLICHLDRVPDDITGGHLLMPKTIGKALAPNLSQYFTDIIHAERRGNKFSWSTITHNADLKARNLPYAANQAPSFAPLIDRWKEHGGVVTSFSEEQQLKMNV